MTTESAYAQEFPILEYDPTIPAIIDIDLEQDRHPEMPEHCVICFFRDVIEHFLEAGLLTRLHTVKSEMLEHPVYLYQIGDQKVALLHQAVGAPLAVYLLEECIGMGARKFIACGGAGVGLRPSRPERAERCCAPPQRVSVQRLHRPEGMGTKQLENRRTRSG